MLLDYGGTLVDEVAFDPRAGNELLLSRAAYRPKNIGIEQVLDRANRVSIDVAARRDEFQLETPWPALTRLIHDFLGVRFADPMAELEMEFWKASVTTRAMPGAREALEEFHRQGVPMGVVSNCAFGQEVLRYEFARYGLADFLMFVMVSSEYSVRKPNSMLFETAAAKLGVASKDIWFVGDRLDFDVAGAKAAGMKAVWFHPENDHRPNDADITVNSWEQLVSCFKEPRSAGWTAPPIL
jgi:putative hydrolase of the HAD superfamily